MIDRNTLYLKQDLIDESKTSILKQLFGRRKSLSQEAKEDIMNAMIDVLSDLNFLNLFKEQEDAKDIQNE